MVACCFRGCAVASPHRPVPSEAKRALIENTLWQLCTHFELDELLVLYHGVYMRVSPVARAGERREGGRAENSSVIMP